MELNVSKKIIISELVIIGAIYTIWMPYNLMLMQFPPVQLLHYLFITIIVLSPIGIASAYYFMDRWECRPIEMLSFYLERGLTPPDDIMAAARVRALNLPLVHSASVLVRYELVTLIDWIYMGTIGDLPFRDNIRLGLSAAIGLAVFPIFSFFLTERLLSPVRQFLSETTRAVRIDESSVIQINTRTRLVSILLTTVVAPLLALSSLIYHRVGVELGIRIGDPAIIDAFMHRFLELMLIVIGLALLLATAIGILLATSISNPLGHMVKVIGELEKGNLDVRANLISNDEIGVLSQSFDKMAQEIERNRADLEDLNRNLELRVTEKTENLTRAYERLQLSNQNLAVTNREIEEANKKLTEIDRLKSDFISVVSHELRTPITSIKAFTELILLKPRMSAERKIKLLNIINTESDRLARLVTDILDLTKIEAGKLSWHIEKIAIKDIIQSSVAGIHSLADNKSIVISMALDQDIPLFYGDKDRLTQVMTNILSNSIKFTPQNGKIRIEAHQEQAPRPQVAVSVSDTGVGIPGEDLDLIFEKFRRSGDVLTNRTEGTGLGLAISRQIINYHGGTIWAESTVGCGSTFIFTVPLDKAWNIEGEQHTVAAHL